MKALQRGHRAAALVRTPRARRLRRIHVPQGPPLPWLSHHLLSLSPMVMHCSSVRVAWMHRLATSGSTLMQYSVSQKRLLMLNSGTVCTTSYCNDQSMSWYLRAPSPALSSRLLHCPLGEVPRALSDTANSSETQSPDKSWGTYRNKKFREISL